jgi:hypothetical protein
MLSRLDGLSRLLVLDYEGAAGTLEPLPDRLALPLVDAASLNPEV